MRLSLPEQLTVSFCMFVLCIAQCSPHPEWSLGYYGQIITCTIAEAITITIAEAIKIQLCNIFNILDLSRVYYPPETGNCKFHKILLGFLLSSLKYFHFHVLGRDLSLFLLLHTTKSKVKFFSTSSVKVVWLASHSLLCAQVSYQEPNLVFGCSGKSPLKPK